MTPGHHAEPPEAVASGVTLIYITLGTGVVRTIIDWPEVSRGSAPEFVLLVGIFVYGASFG